MLQHNLVGIPLKEEWTLGEIVAAGCLDHDDVQFLETLGVKKCILLPDHGLGRRCGFESDNGLVWAIEGGTTAEITPTTLGNLEAVLTQLLIQHEAERSFAIACRIQDAEDGLMLSSEIVAFVGYSEPYASHLPALRTVGKRYGLRVCQEYENRGDCCGITFCRPLGIQASASLCCELLADGLDLSESTLIQVHRYHPPSEGTGTK